MFHVEHFFGCQDGAGYHLLSDRVASRSDSATATAGHGAMARSWYSVESDLDRENVPHGTFSLEPPPRRDHFRGDAPLFLTPFHNRHPAARLRNQHLAPSNCGIAQLFLGKMCALFARRLPPKLRAF